jgi:acylphosphatase
MGESIIRRRAVVRGRVQGVFFRDATREQAEAAGVAGSVRNLKDGTVEVILEGPPDAVQQVLAFSREGPERAHVEHVEVTGEEPQGLTAFEVD